MKQLIFILLAGIVTTTQAQAVELKSATRSLKITTQAEAASLTAELCMNDALTCVSDTVTAEEVKARFQEMSDLIKAEFSGESKEKYRAEMKRQVEENGFAFILIPELGGEIEADNAQMVDYVLDQLIPQAFAMIDQLVAQSEALFAQAFEHAGSDDRVIEVPESMIDENLQMLVQKLAMTKFADYINE